MSTEASKNEHTDEAFSYADWDDDNSLYTHELEVKIPVSVRKAQDFTGKRLTDHFPTYKSIQAFTPTLECEDDTAIRLNVIFSCAILDIRKAIANYEVDMFYWRHYHNRDGENFAAIEDEENKERLYHLLTSDEECEPGDLVYLNVYY
jgi:hypothetical protein